MSSSPSADAELRARIGQQETVAEPGKPAVETDGTGWDDGGVGEATLPTDDESQAGYTLLTEEPVIADDPPRIHVSAERDRDQWVISVRDEGIGIDPDRTDRIFRVFQRLHSHDEHPGTGVGLALSRRIVERHGVRASEAGSSSAGSLREPAGGDIWVDSEPGEGSTFSFALPANEDTNE